MNINGRKIGCAEKPFIIAEAGINHNGNIQTAFEMIVRAKSIGFEAIKFQTFHAAEFNIDDKATYTYRSQGKDITEPMLEMFRRYEFSESEWFQIKRKCDEEGILFLSTPQNVSDLELLLSIGLKAIKVGSDDFTNIHLLKEYRKAGLPMILSCGMADLGEIYISLEAVEAFDREDVALLLCTSEYPTPPEDVNLLKLRTLRGTFPNLTLGFSDHTQGSLAASVAVGFEACIFEKHYTLDNNMEGPDQWFSANPAGLKRWHDDICKSWQMLGQAALVPTEKEREMKRLARRSIFVKETIQKGEVIQDKHLAMYRPGVGLSGAYWNDIVGKKATKRLDKGKLLKWGDFCE